MITPLTGELLAAWSRGLQKWRKILDDYEKPRQKTSERRGKYRRWKDEIDRLSHTLEHLWEVHRLSKGGKPPHGMTYVSEDLAAAEGRSTHGPDPRFTEPLWDWMERLVIWIGGSEAGLRFHKSLLPHVESRAAREKRSLIARALPQLRSLRDSLIGLPRAQMAKTVRKALSGIAEEILTEFAVQIPKSPRDIQKHVEYLIADCEKASAGNPPPARLVGSAAALCAVDGAQIPLPTWLLMPGDQEDVAKRVRFINKLQDEHSEPGYDLLLSALGETKDALKRDLRVIRKFLAAGVEKDDAIWADRRLSWGAEALADKSLSPHSFRALAAVLEKSGLNFNKVDVSLADVAEKTASRGSTNIVEAFTLWLSTLNPASLDKKIVTWAWNCICRILVLEGISPALRDTLRQWAEPPKTGVRLPPEIAVTVAPEIREWLSKLHYYQKMSGHKPALPASLSRMFDAGGRESGELEHLRELRTNGRLDERMASRLALLESREGKSRSASQQRILKQAQEVCAHAALEAIRHLSHREGLLLWKRQIGIDPPSHLTDDQVFRIAAWGARLDKTAARRLQELLEVWKECGSNYRERLPLNSDWLRAAATRIDLRAWFSPEPCEVDLHGLNVTIGLSPDPIRIFLMGDFFRTCLSIDSSKELSVLTNAYDANKAVVFALGSDSQVLARKLVCLGSDFRLLGFRTYVAENESLTEERKKSISSLMDAFCGRWARRVGLPLGQTGAPAKLSGLYWYDDGAEPWLPSAINAWADPALEIKTAAARAGVLMPKIADALSSKLQDCLDLLDELGIPKPTGVDGCREFADAPDLAEEVLAILARESQDVRLARLVFENAVTEGGRIEALTSVALLEKIDEMAEQVFAAARSNSEMADRAMEVLRRMDFPKAWQLFMKLAVSEVSNVEELWLTLAVADSVDSADALIDTCFTPGRHDIYFPEHFMVQEMLAGLDMRLPQAVVLDAFVSFYPENRLYLAEWMPPCPDVLKRHHLAKMAEFDEDDKEDEQHAVLSTAIVAMANPGPRSSAYLKNMAEREPAALLALSLLYGGKYREFIRKTAFDMSAEPAAVLALLVSEGEPAADDLLKATLKSYPHQGAMINSVRELHRGFSNLDGGMCVDFFESTQLGKNISLLPYVIWRLWRWTDAGQPNIPALSALMASGNTAEFLYAQKVCLSGLSVRLAGLLRNAIDENAAPLRETLLNLLDKKSSLRSGGDALLLNKLCDEKLWADPPSGDRGMLLLGDALNCAGAWELLLDEAGNERPVLKWVDWKTVYDIRFPLDIKTSACAMELLMSVIPPGEISKKIRPITGLQKRLLEKAGSDAER
ncbi:MAG: hypothetical protein SCM96_08525 [Acidobacteriota bacterium]|nr:hypothetical protein [Acidobacteriota bacterium]